MTEITIVGGGIMGLLTARELVRGGCRVTVLDRGEIGRESSWAGGGILSPLYPWRYPGPVNALTGWSQHHYPGLCAELRDSTGIDPEWERSGQLVLDGDQVDEALQWQRGYPALLAGCGLDGDLGEEMELEVVAGQTLDELEPGLAVPGPQAVWLPRVAQVRNPRLLQALRLDLAERGVVLREGVTVTGFRHRNGRLAGLETDAGPVETGTVLVSAGAWTGELLAATGLVLPVRPVKGQMILYRSRPGMLKRILIYRRHYLIPRRDGRVLVGSTMEETGFEKTATVEARDRLREAAQNLLPALEGATVEAHWAGLRPGSPDGVPFLDRHPLVDNLYVCSGHFRNGLAMAPASARLMADLVLGRPTLLDPGPYRVNSTAEKGDVA